MKKAKFRKHKYVEKAPALTGMLMSILYFFVVQIVMTLINIVIHVFVDSYDDKTGIAGLIIGVIIAMVVYKWWFNPKFEGMVKGNFGLGFLLGLAIMVYLVVGSIPSVLLEGMPQIKPMTMTIIATSLTAGLTEEFGFRGVLVSTLMREWKNDDKFRKTAIISGAVFGLIHASNILAGADPIMTVFQVASAFCSGIFFAAMYLRCGTVIPCMFYHALYDMIVLWISSNVNETGLITGGTLRWDSFYDLALNILLAGFAFWLLRPSKNSEMRELWNRKWHQPLITKNEQ